MPEMTPDISVIVPVFNEEGNLPLLTQRLQQTLQAMEVQFEILFVNDGSRDGSLALLRSLAQKHAEVRYLSFSRNFGHQIAVSAGLEHSLGNAVVIIDADLQDPPETIARLWQKMQEGFEVVYAKRRTRKGESWLKLATAKAFYRILDSLTPVPIPLDTGDFRIIDRKVVDVLKQMPEQQRFLRGMIAWAGFRQGFVEYDRDARHAGETGYSYGKMIRFALDGITAFSDIPLRIATWLGFLVSGVAFLVLLYALYSRLISHDYVPGWASIIVAILFLGGIQLLTIGIIGEYVGRLSSNVKKRPLYIVAEKS